MPIFATTDAGSVDTSFVVSAVRPSDVVLSPDGLRIYASGADGNVRVYHGETGNLLATWDVGINLGALDLSPDGDYLWAVERQHLGTDGPGWGAETNITLYRIDVATGEVEEFPFVATDYDLTFSDVAALSNGQALLTQNFGGSGWVQLKLIDPATGNYTEAGSMRHGSILSRSLDGSRVLIGEADISDAPLHIFEAGTGLVASHGSYQDDVSGYNSGVQAVRGDGTLVAQYLGGSGIHIYDGALDYQLNLADEYPDWYNGISALAFDESGDFLFLLDSDADAVVQLSTADWSVVQTVPIGIDITAIYGDYGNNLLVSEGLRYFTIITDNELYRLDNPLTEAEAVTGTAGNNVLAGTGWSETILGLDGNDTLGGGGGADRMEGGKGHDIYIVNSSGDEVVEAGSSGNDTVRSSVSFTLPVHLEKLILTGSFGYDGRGNAGDNTITGNGGGNFLSGGRGNDIIDGGAGNDEILGGLGSDSLRGGAGADRFSFNSALGSGNVDRILDFSVVDDVIRLDRAVFNGAGPAGTLNAAAFQLGSAATEADDRILYDSATGRIYYDADGSGAAAAIHFATVTAGTALTHADFTLYG